VDPVDYVAPVDATAADPADAPPTDSSGTKEPARGEQLSPRQDAAAKPQTPARPRSATQEGKKAQPAKPTFTPPATIATGRPGRPRNREFTAPFSSQLAQDVDEIIDAAVAREGLTRRNIVEMAIRQTWGSVVEDQGDD